VIIRISKACLLIVVLVLAAGCKKNVELSAPDDAAPAVADPAAQAAAAASAAPVVAAAEIDAALPPLDDPNAKKPTTTTTTAAKPKVGDAGSKPAASAAPTATVGSPTASIPECIKASRHCNHPAVANDAAMKASCEANKSICLQKGGHL
jgi:hypothetical protein